MGFKKWISATAASLLLAASFQTATIQAEESRTIADESIYDLLVDRFFNGTASNDINVNTQDNTQFAGGDFTGLMSRSDHIQNMGFSIVSVGSIFTTEKYDGSMITSYSELEPHFGTSDEFKQVVETFKEKDMTVMVDFPLSKVSENHEWVKDAAKADWISDKANGIASFDLGNVDVQAALKEAIITFVSTYGVGGIRLTNLDGASTEFVNELIDEIKAIDSNIYVISNEESPAHFDASYYEETNKIYRNIYKNVDLDSSNITKYVDPYLHEGQVPSQIMFDNLWTNRFTYDVFDGQHGHPPTRMKMAYAATLLLPGVPVIQYGSEIAMNGKVGPESHQYYNFKTDEELIDFIKNLQSLRNQSDTLRSGDFEILKNEDGFLAFKRESEKETWIVVINNTSVTDRVNISPELIGEGKEIRGMFESEIIRENKEGYYPIILDREMVEVYQVIDERGINVSYLVALGIVYVLFTVFVISIVKRGRKRRAEQNTHAK
ncbi:alpha-amylase family glycosyl hydrolase [Lysinibacillus sp. 54212]|uniref:alpha-amylase family glycosyl hydrolase n=1 Tax=Lysinibacillus sp. 54212 TaxID=3119829 RepID=UPI002FC8259D